jgi:hypothetical protein
MRKILLVVFGVVFFSFANVNALEEKTYEGNVEPIEIKSGKQVITLKNVTIDATGKKSAAITVDEGAELTLILEGENKLTGDGGYAGIAVMASYDDDWNYSEELSAKLTIKGSGNLTAQGGDGYTGSTIIKTAGGAAGIGGNGQNFNNDEYDQQGVDFGTIIISEDFTGTIRANGGKQSSTVAVTDKINGGRVQEGFGGGAGIGSGGFSAFQDDTLQRINNWYLLCGKIIIENGTIIANENLGNSLVGAGIGAGSAHTKASNAVDYSDIIIKISGGNITAQGGNYSAGIGGGNNCNSGTIEISGGVIKAESGKEKETYSAAGIGGGSQGAPTKIIITGGNVTAISYGCGAGIGGGGYMRFSWFYSEGYGDRSEEHTGIITIKGKNTVVTASAGGIKGSYGGAGIGSGTSIANNDGSIAIDISILDNATVYAYGGDVSQAIGYGVNVKSTDEYYTGYGIRLYLDDTVKLTARNKDTFMPALVAATKYDENPITYVSTKKIYLVSHTNNVKTLTSIAKTDSLNTVALTSTLAEPTAVSSYELNDEVLSITIDDVTKDVEWPSTSYNGNFALLHSIEVDKVDEEEPIENETDTIIENPKTGISYNPIIIGIIILLISSITLVFITNKNPLKHL